MSIFQKPAPGSVGLGGGGVPQTEYFCDWGLGSHPYIAATTTITERQIGRKDCLWVDIK